MICLLSMSEHLKENKRKTKIEVCKLIFLKKVVDKLKNLYYNIEVD